METEYKVEKTIKVTVKNKCYNYYFHPHHRNSNPKKSQWVCSLREEVNLFAKGIRYNWKENSKILYSILNYKKPIGKSNDGRELFFSKFISNTHKEWHGYPADYVRNPQDRPKKEILKSWLDNNSIKKSHIRKILKGQPW